MKTKKMEAGGVTNTKPKKGFLAKGEVPSPDEGYRGDEPIENMLDGYTTKESEKKYMKEARTQDSINNPLVRGARKAATYVKEKYGDIRDDVRTAVTGDDSAKYRGMQRGVREDHLSYSKGGSVSSASRGDGAAKRGRTKGRTL